MKASKIEALEMELQILREQQQAANKRLRSFYKGFTQTQLARILSKNMSREEVERCIRKIEYDSHNPEGSSDESDGSDSGQNIAAFNEPVPVDDEEAVDRIELDTKLNIIHLRTK